MSTSHHSKRLIRQGWIQVFFRVIEPGPGRYVAGDSSYAQGGLTLHGTTWNRPTTYDELLTSVETELCATTFDFGSAGTRKGQFYLEGLRSAFDIAVPFIDLNGTEYRSRFEFFFDVNGGVYAS